jgi:hypothetical protein
MTGWRERWIAVVTSDVSDRDGLGWEFSSTRGASAWTVFREDGGAFPVFSATRGEVLPSQEDLRAMTNEAVADLLAAAGFPDEHGWITANISAALMLASMSVASWQGEEWAVEGPGEVWADPEDARTPYAWLRAVGNDREALIGVYQDDAVFGLSFLPAVDFQLPERDHGALRSRRDIPLVRGSIRRVDVVYDTLVEGGSAPGVLSEVLLQGDTGSTLLIAAEAYSRDEWHLFDESVVVLTDTRDLPVPVLTSADSLTWIPPRQTWRPA